jgi:hypothetical protein
MIEDLKKLLPREKDQPEEGGWADKLNKILWDNLDLKEDFQRPMKVTLQRDLLVFCKELEQEAYNRGVKEAKEKMVEVLKPHITYCQEQNGLPYCKNCGLDLEEIKKKLI